MGDARKQPDWILEIERYWDTKARCGLQLAADRGRTPSQG